MGGRRNSQQLLGSELEKEQSIGESSCLSDRVISIRGRGTGDLYTFGAVVDERQAVSGST